MKHYLLPDISEPGKIGCSLPDPDVPAAKLPSEEILRDELNMPEVSEIEVARYFNALSRLNYGAETGFYPLGSCTMKYNPYWHEDVSHLPGFDSIHPLQSEETVQGALELMCELQGYLSEITGMKGTSLVPLAGAHGEYACLLMVKAYHLGRGDKGRNKILLTDSSHGTNPASAVMCGFDIGVVASDPNGNVDMKSLETMMNDGVAALTLTMPSTLGLFDPQILEISHLVHSRGGLLGADGANLNAFIGKVKFADLGFDYVQLNLHKTFSTPHGGGGPGSGPVCVNEKLTKFLPAPIVTKSNDHFSFTKAAESVGRICSFHGNFGTILKAWAYIRTLGAAGLKEVSENAVVNANYIRVKLKQYYYLPYDRICMHEVVFSGRRQKSKGVTTEDITKRLLDYGLHPPTVYFPLIVDEAIMIEPTETESKKTIDNYINAMIEIALDAESNPTVLKTAPHNAPRRRLDMAKAALQPELRWHMY